MAGDRKAGARNDRKPVPRAAIRYGPNLFPWLLALAAVAAFITRLLFLYELKATPFFSANFSDSRIYLELARAISRGDTQDVAYFMSPIYPYLLAVVDSLAGDVEFWQRLLQCAIGACTTVLTGLLARRMWNPGAGLVACLFTALSPQLIFLDNMILTESLLTASIMAHLYFADRLWRGGSTADGAFAGIALGLAIVTRFSLMAAPLLYCVAYAFARKGGRPPSRTFAVMLIAAAACVAPFTIRNAVVEGVFVPVTSSGGFNYYAGNNASSEGWHRVPESVDLYRDPNGADYASRVKGRRLNSSEVSAFWFSKAWTWASRNPSDWLSLQLRKLLLFAHFGELDQTGLSSGFFRKEYGGLLSAPLPGWPLLLFLSLLGAASALHDRRLSGPAALFVLAFVVSTVLFFVNARLRAPILPVFALYAAHGIEAVWTALRRRSRSRAAYLAGGASLFGLALLFQPAIPETHESEYRILGDAAFKRGDYRTAERYCAAALSEIPTPNGYVNMGNALAASGRYGEAEACYDSALAMRPDFALAWFNLGNLALQKNDAAEALRRWKRAVELDPDLSAGHRNLGLLLARSGRLQEAVAALERAYALERDRDAREMILRDLRYLRGGPRGE